ncbi:MAG: NAD(P)-dependent oxidoreductase [Hyphomicrobiaceae bacterium]
MISHQTTHSSQESNSIMNVGYVGLGSMGGAIVKRMLLNKQPLRVFDLDPKKVSEIAEAGGQPAQSAAALAEQSDIVCLCLPTSDNVRAAIFGENGLAKGLKPGSLVADMTTGDPLQTKEMAAELAKQGVTLIDAPVSGGPAGAQAGTLAIMVGAPADVYERIKPVFEKVGPNVFRVGDVGAGQTMKLVNNLMLATGRAIAFEAMALAVKNGLDPKLATEVLNKSSGRNGTTERSLADTIDGKFPASFALGLMTKDVRLANQLGRDTGVPMILGRIVEELHNVAMNNHGPQACSNILVKDFEQRAKTKITK